MISYQANTKFWQRSWFAALIGGLAVGGGVWWWQAHQDAEQAAEVASSAKAQSQPLAPQKPVFSTPVAGNPASAPTILPDGRPSDFTPEDWAALKAAMSNQPNAKSEMARVVAYLRFQRSFEQWQALADSRDVAKRHQLAESLLSQVPDRMSKGEVTAGEALLLSTALLTDLQPDETLREQRLAEMRARIEASAPKSDAEQAARDEEKIRELNQRQQAIVAAWQAKPENSRDQAALERDLETARRAVYGSPKR